MILLTPLLNSMKINIITGSYPPDVCGVGDYICQLVNSLTELKQEIYVNNYKNWKFSNLFKLRKEIIKKQSDVVHIQYPTEGYGYSIVPQLLNIVLNARVVVTIHEFSSKSIHGKMAIYLFFIFADQLIFTTEEECLYAQRFAPFIKKKSTVINIGSNVPFVSTESKKTYDAVYFGQIRPAKGLEDFISLAQISTTSNINFLIIGQFAPNYENYYNTILGSAKDLNIEWKLNLSATDVALALGTCKFAYLPFPDGVTRRRGTFLAAIGNGCTIITKKGKATTESFNELCLYAETPHDAFRYIINEVNVKQLNKEVINDFVNMHSWKNIAAKHIDLYNTVV